MSVGLSEQESFRLRCSVNDSGVPVFDTCNDEDHREFLIEQAEQDIQDNGGVMPASTHSRLAEAGVIVID